LAPSTDWSTALNGVSVVVHCAARVHVMRDTSVDPLEEFRRVNVQGTLNLARQAAAAGVRRFVFVSSIKVNGEATQPGCPFTADDILAPLDPYGVSKMEAEQALREIVRQTGMEVVIIRPPLVYGPGVKANFAAMMRWLQRGVPLPLGAIHNQRSLVALDNLVDLIMTCIKHPAAANQTFLVSDGEDASTTELLRRMGQAMGHPARLLPVPASWLKLAAGLIDKRDVAQRLCGSLQVDISKTRELLGWVPPVSLDEGLRRAATGHGLPRFARNDGRLE
jgi:UDP-glucose 4-epimerase